MYGADLAREAPLVLLMRTAAAGTVKEALRDVRFTQRAWDFTIVRPADGFQRPPNLPWTAEWYEVIGHRAGAHRVSGQAFPGQRQRGRRASRRARPSLGLSVYLLF